MKNLPHIVIILILLLADVALAQEPPGGFDGPPPPPPGPPPATLASTPVEALATGLKLTSLQHSKFLQLHLQFRHRFGALLPVPGQRLPRPPMGRPSMRGMQTRDRKISQNMLALLTPAQKQALPGLLTLIDNMRRTGLPAELLGRLSLSRDQKTRLAGLARQPPPRPGEPRDMRQARAILTPAQKALVVKFERRHPHPRFGPPPPDFSGRPEPPPDGFMPPGAPR